MGWSIGWDSKWKRDIGYGVPAFCDHPDCNKGIDRGLSYVCGTDPFGGEHGCGLHFCADHKSMAEDDKDNAALCSQCMQDLQPFSPKADHPEWVEWKLTDDSWQGWRNDNPQAVAALREILNK